MSSAQFTISTTNITANSVDINVVLSDVAVSDETLDIVVSTTNETVYTGSMTIPSGDTTGILSVSNLRSNTQYTATATSSSTYTDSAVFITLEDPTPRIPTQTQWEGLADKVNSSARIGKVLSKPSSIKYVKADNIDFTTLSGNYSTSEQDTGFTWIGGQKIYKKTVNIGNPPKSSRKEVSHGVTNIDYVIRIESVLANSTRTNQVAIPFASVNNVTDNIEIAVSKQKVQVTTAIDYWGNNYDTFFATIYYTKTS